MCRQWWWMQGRAVLCRVELSLSSHRTPCLFSLCPAQSSKCMSPSENTTSLTSVARRASLHTSPTPHLSVEIEKFGIAVTGGLGVSEGGQGAFGLLM